MATCYEISVFVNNNFSQLNESPENFTNWITDTYTNIIDDILNTESDSGNNNINGSSNVTSNDDCDEIASVMSVSRAAYELTVDHTDTNELDIVHNHLLNQQFMILTQFGMF